MTCPPSKPHDPHVCVLIRITRTEHEALWTIACVDHEQLTDRLEARNEAVPEVRKHQGDLTASTSTERTGGRGL